MRVIDWLARTAMLVLAGLATLALIGSLASVSDAPVGEAFRESAGLPVADDSPATRPAGSPPGIDAVRVAEEGGATPPSAVVAAPPGEATDREIARWLTALTYALLALTAVAAAGVIALVRIGGHLARIAER